MATLYLTEQNSILRKQGERLLVCQRPPANRRYSAVLQSDILLDLPCADVEHVMLFGNVQVTTSAMHKMLEHGIELALFSFSGELLGQLSPVMGKNVELRMRQFRQVNDPEIVLQMSRKFVTAKIGNALYFLKRFRWNNPGVYTDQELDEIKRLLDKSEHTGTLDSLRGLEGAAAAGYFELLSRMFRPPWKFEGRSRRPPKDPVNAVLSFGYTIIGSQIQALMDGSGLDPYLGFYHQMEYGRPSLALDLLEEFRHPFVDRLTLNLFNRSVFAEGDFYKPPAGGVYMNNSGKKKFFRHFEALLGEAREVVNEQNIVDNQTPNKSYYRIYQEQIRRLINAVKEESEYEPYHFEL